VAVALLQDALSLTSLITAKYRSKQCTLHETRRTAYVSIPSGSHISNAALVLINLNSDRNYISLRANVVVTSLGMNESVKETQPLPVKSDNLYQLAGCDG